MVNQSKINSPNYWRKLKESGAVGTMPGKAYGFFDCRAPIAELEATLPDIRKAVDTPKKLELLVTEDFTQLSGDAEILDIAKEAKDAGIRYAMQASYTNATHKKTADELAAILNQAYQSDLYSRGEPFRGWIFYKEGKRYVERE